MAASPKYKVYDAHGEYQASVKDIESGACLMGMYGDGATIRLGHRVILWTEGAEDRPAGESYDHVAIVAFERIAGHWERTVSPGVARAIATIEGR